MLVKKQMKYFYVPLDHAWKVPVLQELLITRTNNLYVEGFNDIEMLNMLCNEMINFAYLCIILRIFLFSFVRLHIQKMYLNKFKLHHLYMYIFVCE